MAEFKTAYLQAVLSMDVAVIGSVNAGVEVTSTNRKAAICRNDFVVLTPAAGSNPAYIKKATAAQVTAKQATHIVALNDMTIGNGHFATDRGDYRVSELIGATGSAIGASVPVKKVGLYPIYDWADVIPDADGNDNSGT